MFCCKRKLVSFKSARIKCKRKSKLSRKLSASSFFPSRKIKNQSSLRPPKITNRCLCKSRNWRTSIKVMMTKNSLQWPSRALKFKTQALDRQHITLLCTYRAVILSECSRPAKPFWINLVGEMIKWPWTATRSTESKSTGTKQALSNFLTHLSSNLWLTLGKTSRQQMSKKIIRSNRWPVSENTPWQ